MSCVGEVINSIKRMILDGAFRRGARLPVEKEVAGCEAARLAATRISDDALREARTKHEEHLAISKALAARDPERARIRMANHLLGVEEPLRGLPDDDPPSTG